MSIDQLPHPPEWLQQWMLAASKSSNEAVRNLLYVREFIESAIIDERSAEAGLWQGNAVLRALANIDRTIELTRPIPVSERKPLVGKGNWGTTREECGWVFAHAGHDGGRWFVGYWNGKRFIDDSRDEEELPLVTHWCPMMPKPTAPE